MGYCTWTPNRNTGGAVVAWIGTGTDVGKQVTVSYRKGALGATNKTAACADVRNQWCKKYGVGGRCYAVSGNVPCVQREGDKWGYLLSGQPVPPSCGDLTYKPDPNKGTGTKPPVGAKPGVEYCAGGPKTQVCAKNCSFLDLPCLSAKLQCSCGGSGAGNMNNCFGTGVPCIVLGGALILLLLLFRR